MHGTGGAGRAFLSPPPVSRAELFGPGQPLDATKYFIVLPDGIGQGNPPNPATGCAHIFPRYCYPRHGDRGLPPADRAASASNILAPDHGNVDGRHAFLEVFGEMYPEFMDALMPLASAPVEIGGRNRMLRRMIIDSIRDDPEWKNGDHKTASHASFPAQYSLTIMTSSPLQMLKQWPTRRGSGHRDRQIDGAMRTDANDMLYQFESSTDYNPQPELEKIKRDSSPSTRPTTR